MKTPRELLLKKHEAVEGKLDQMWRATLRRGLRNATDAMERVPPARIGWKLWRELIWPCGRIWAVLACAWALIAVLNFASSEPATRVTSKTEPLSREQMRALVEQRRILAQLIDPMPTPPDKREFKPLGPRSEKAPKTAAA